MPPTSIERKRHYHTLSEQETDGVVDAVADLIVNFLKGSRDPERRPKRGQEPRREPDAALQHESR
ncbi:MAG TPA: hypothetical protein PLA43_20485 [Bryobacteraceae bacterium]|nr:hypothetical protein [Bryobacteraceae bacterium]HOQ47681.1 hypothetical protein [Bryobacteraceae bacterium]HPU74338.1 hypothetical protein [Bryobacteraceae bacterium]